MRNCTNLTAIGLRSCPYFNLRTTNPVDAVIIVIGKRSNDGLRAVWRGLHDVACFTELEWHACIRGYKQPPGDVLFGCVVNRHQFLVPFDDNCAIDLQDATLPYLFNDPLSSCGTRLINTLSKAISGING